MKVSKRVKQLLRQGYKPKELIGLGSLKSIVTRVYRQLSKERTVGKLQKSTRGKVGNNLRITRTSRIAVIYAYIEAFGDLIESMRITLSKSGLNLECPRCMESELDLDDEGTIFTCKDCKYKIPFPSRVWKENWRPK